MSPGRWDPPSKVRGVVVVRFGPVHPWPASNSPWMIWRCEPDRHEGWYGSFSFVHLLLLLLLLNGEGTVEKMHLPPLLLLLILLLYLGAARGG